MYNSSEVITENILSICKTYSHLDCFSHSCLNYITLINAGIYNFSFYSVDFYNYEHCYLTYRDNVFSKGVTFSTSCYPELTQDSLNKAIHYKRAKKINTYLTSTLLIALSDKYLALPVGKPNTWVYPSIRQLNSLGYSDTQLIDMLNI